MDGHVALDALAVILRWLGADQRGVILGQPVGHLALRRHHGGLQGAQVPPSRSSTSQAALLGARPVVVGSELWHVVLDGDFAWGGVVKLYGEGGVTLSYRADSTVGSEHSYSDVMLCFSDSK